MTKKSKPALYSAILAIDPAQGGTGMALRPTAPFVAVPPERHRLGAPTWTFGGRVVDNPDWADDLAAYCHEHLPADARLGLVMEDCAFRSLTIARSIGQAIGSVRFALRALNLVAPGDDPVKVTPKVWRKWAMPAVAPGVGRDQWKEEARFAVLGLYGMHDPTKDADIAEATLLLDYACCVKRAWWAGKEEK
jgi:hypothetical protein